MPLCTFARICQMRIICCKKGRINCAVLGEGFAALNCIHCSGLPRVGYTLQGVHVLLESISIWISASSCLFRLVAFLMSRQTNMTALSPKPPLSWKTLKVITYTCQLLVHVFCVNLLWGVLRNGPRPCQDVARVLGQTTGSKHDRNWH